MGGACDLLLLAARVGLPRHVPQHLPHARAAQIADIRSPSILDHIPPYRPLYGGVYSEGLTTCCLSLPVVTTCSISAFGIFRAFQDVRVAGVEDRISDLAFRIQDPGFNFRVSRVRQPRRDGSEALGSGSGFSFLVFRFPPPVFGFSFFVADVPVFKLRISCLGFRASHARPRGRRAKTRCHPWMQKARFREISGIVFPA